MCYILLLLKKIFFPSPSVFSPFYDSFLSATNFISFHYFLPTFSFLSFSFSAPSFLTHIFSFFLNFVCYLTPFSIISHHSLLFISLASSYVSASVSLYLCWPLYLCLSLFVIDFLFNTTPAELKYL